MLTSTLDGDGKAALRSVRFTLVAGGEKKLVFVTWRGSPLSGLYAANRKSCSPSETKTELSST